VSPALEILFSIRQGDPASSIFFTIYTKPFLVALETNLKSFSMVSLCKVAYSLRMM
jgi:hypothetical protein